MDDIPTPAEPLEPERRREHACPLPPALHHAPILEAVAAMFPPEPKRADIPTGSGETFEDARQEWVQTCTSLAVQASDVPELLERVERAEHGRDAILDVLDRFPLPPEPRRQDYITSVEEITAGGEAIRWSTYLQDHTRWRDNVSEAVAAREQAIRQATSQARPRTTYLPPQFHHERLPRDLIAVTTLQALLATHPEITDTILPREHREHLAVMLEAADAQVRIPDPDDPDESAIYEGEASEAHQWIEPGVYPATGIDGVGEFRVVVGPTGSGTTGSAAFPPGEHDSRILDEIAHLLEYAPEESDPVRLLAGISTLVTDTGREGLDLDLTVETGTSFRNLLQDRPHEIDDDEPPRSRPGREDPGLSR